MRVRRFLRDAVWFVALTATGIALILADVNVGLPTLLDLLTSRPM